MSAIPVAISGMLYDKTGRTAQPVVIFGELSHFGLTIGGGPIFPDSPQPPLGIWGPPGPWPTPPIHLGPGGGIGGPPVIGGGPIIPPMPIEPPSNPDEVKPPPPGGGWGYSPEYGWGYFPMVGGKPQPPGTK